MCWLHYYQISFIYENGSMASPDLLFLYLPRIGESFTTFDGVDCEIVKEVTYPGSQFTRTMILRPKES